MKETQLNPKEKMGCIEGLKGFGACMIAFVWHYQHFAPQEGIPFYRLFALFYDMGDRMVEVFSCFQVFVWYWDMKK